MEVVAINDLADRGELAHLFKYDSVHGRLAAQVRVEDDRLRVDEDSIRFTQERDPSKLAWGELGVSVVIEATGAFRKRDRAAAHLDAGAQRVIISAPSKDADGMFVLGVNHDQYDPSKHRVVSMASCTTNCLAPVAKVLHETFGIEHALITTVHAYTATQAILDGPLGNYRRSRAAALSIIPTTTGAAVAVTKVLPQLEGRMDGMALRVPVPDGSVTDIVARLENSASAESVNDALRAAARGPMKGVLSVCEDPIVSADIVGDPHSSIVDAPSTMMVGDRAVKLLSWYDNEWGYASRLVDFAHHVCQ